METKDPWFGGRSQKGHRVSKITLQVIDGVDKGRVFREIPTPVTIGREEGNVVRLNDERVSRFHVRVLQDQEDIILTDLDSTNGTRVNGNVVQIHRLRAGDCVSIGRSVLLFGSSEEIADRMAHQPGPDRADRTVSGGIEASKSQHALTILHSLGSEPVLKDADLDFAVDDELRITHNGLFIGDREFPPLPRNLGPSQGARLSEILTLVHRSLAHLLERVRVNENAGQATLSFATWQKMLAIEALLARYLRAITEPDSWQ